ncbi:MAG TPA: DUF2344 domain-containing protein [Candidatus Copromonas avistercoris]|nr:DUF2344 domain-containing protein [Candidatus Copromonas avistercoris]
MKIRIKFSKQGATKYIGHLDLMRYFQKAMRRADIAIRYSEGFSPHQIMSFAAPLGLGLTGSGEYLDIEVTAASSSAEMEERLNAVMAEDIKILSCKRLPDDAANAMSLVAACDYTVRLHPDYADQLPMSASQFFSGLISFIETGNMEIMKKTKKGEKPVDLRSHVHEYRLLPDGEGCFLRLSAGSEANIKPELLLSAYGQSLGLSFPAYAFLMNREEVYAADPHNAGAYIPLEAFGERFE